MVDTVSVESLSVSAVKRGGVWGGGLQEAGS